MVNFSFQVFTPRFIKHATYLSKNGQKYLLFQLIPTQKGGVLLNNQKTENITLLVVPDNNSTFTNQLKKLEGGEKRETYTTSFSNLKFLSQFHNFYEGLNEEESVMVDGLLIKNADQVQKINQNLTFELTFKVVKQFKEGHGWGDKKRRLTYQESFSQGGNYEHILEIEPVNLGIENFPSITRIVFDFAKPIPPGTCKPLRESNLYNNSILTQSVGKTFSLKVKSWYFGGATGRFGYDTLYFGDDTQYEWDSLHEKHTGRTPNDYSEERKPNKWYKPTDYPKTWIGIILSLFLILVIFLVGKMYQKKTILISLF